MTERARHYHQHRVVSSQQLAVHVYLAFKHQGRVSKAYTCTAGKISPEQDTDLLKSRALQKITKVFATTPTLRVNLAAASLSIAALMVPSFHLSRLPSIHMPTSTESTVCLGDAPAKSRSATAVCSGIEKMSCDSQRNIHNASIPCSSTHSSDTETTQSFAFHIAYQIRHLCPSLNVRLRNHVE